MATKVNAGWAAIGFDLGNAVEVVRTLNRFDIPIDHIVSDETNDKSIVVFKATPAMLNNLKQELKDIDKDRTKYDLYPIDLTD